MSYLGQKKSAEKMMDEHVVEEEVTPLHAAEFIDPICAVESKDINELLDDGRQPDLVQASCPVMHQQIEPKEEGGSVSAPRAPASVLSQHSSSSFQLDSSNSNRISSIQLNSSDSNPIYDRWGNIPSTSVRRRVKILRKSVPRISDGQQKTLEDMYMALWDHANSTQMVPGSIRPIVREKEVAPISTDVTTKNSTTPTNHVVFRCYICLEGFTKKEVLMKHMDEHNTGTEQWRSQGGDFKLVHDSIYPLV